mmetsp:Transcript_41259/g.36606  ORF Transcript_41259/g.36606 Transcript_41259/m.36606 type:complete len:365 (-) Transcript_41259:159-1253(-)
MSCLMGVFLSELLLRAKNVAGEPTLMGIGKKVLGERRGYLIITICNIVNNLGLGTTYLVVVGVTGKALALVVFDSCSKESSYDLYCHQWFYTIVAGLLVLPLSFAKSMAALKNASTVKVCAIAFFCGMTICYCFYIIGTGKVPDDLHYLPSFSSAMEGLGSINIVTGAVSYHYAYLSIYPTVVGQCDKNMRKTTYLGIGMVCFVYASIGFCGYLAFGHAGDNLLVSFTPDNVGTFLFVMFNIAFTSSALITFPVVFFDAKNCIIEIIESSIKKRSSTKEAPIEPQESINPTKEDPLIPESKPTTQESNTQSSTKRNMMILIIHLSCIGVAVFIPSILTAFKLIGGTTLNIFMYMFPCLFYILIT